jgi:hypothetical protein
MPSRFSLMQCPSKEERALLNANIVYHSRRETRFVVSDKIYQLISPHAISYQHVKLCSELSRAWRNQSERVHARRNYPCSSRLSNVPKQRSENRLIHIFLASGIVVIHPIDRDVLPFLHAHDQLHVDVLCLTSIVVEHFLNRVQQLLLQLRRHRSKLTTRRCESHSRAARALTHRFACACM